MKKTALPSKADNREIGRVVEAATTRGLNWSYRKRDDDHDELLIAGGDAELFIKDMASVAPKGKPVYSGGKGKARIVWEPGIAAEPKKEKLHPVDPALDEEIIAVIPHRLTSLAQIKAVCEDVCLKIDEAYPDVALHENGYGKGKWRLVALVCNSMAERSDRLLTNSGAVILFGMLRHCQADKGADLSKFELPNFPDVFAR